MPSPSPSQRVILLSELHVVLSIIMFRLELLVRELPNPERFPKGYPHLRGFLRGPRNGIVFSGFQRYSGVLGFSDTFIDFRRIFSGLERFLECPLRNPLRVPFYPQSCASCCP